MKISTRGRYGVRMMLELATCYGDGPVQLKEIAKSQQISLQYLEQLVRPLQEAGLIQAVRGVKGGVWLSKPPHNITLGRIIRLLTGPIAPVKCVLEPGICQRSVGCVTRDVWCEVGQAMEGVLESVTLQELITRQQKKHLVKRNKS